jgi:hypothetical protein
MARHAASSEALKKPAYKKGLPGKTGSPFFMVSRQW